MTVDTETNNIMQNNSLEKHPFIKKLVLKAYNTGQRDGFNLALDNISQCSEKFKNEMMNFFEQLIKESE